MVFYQIIVAVVIKPEEILRDKFGYCKEFHTAVKNCRARLHYLEGEGSEKVTLKTRRLFALFQTPSSGTNGHEQAVGSNIHETFVNINAGH